ncbi:MAG: hypothetical protein IT373_22950 [Polyangiaceae bacterium]|nr:hypothetical protein [Polyangiaceae bacterium]
MLLPMVIIAVGTLHVVSSCHTASVVPLPSGGVGEACTPAEEQRGDFAGYSITEVVDAQSPDCASGFCLVNHFQGRVSCPRGQAAATRCTTDAECTPPDTCTVANEFAPPCDPAQTVAGQNPACSSGMCDEAGGYCACGAPSDCPLVGGYTCDVAPGASSGVCRARVCSSPARTDRCYLPGTDTPVVVDVCGQCAADGLRDAAGAVYCSCRCGALAGEDPSADFCECPAGYGCHKVLASPGTGGPSGMFCIKEGSTYTGDAQCGTLPAGHHNAVQCAGW